MANNKFVPVKQKGISQVKPKNEPKPAVELTEEEEVEILQTPCKGWSRKKMLKERQELAAPE